MEHIDQGVHGKLHHDAAIHINLWKNHFWIVLKKENSFHQPLKMKQDCFLDSFYFFQL